MLICTKQTNKSKVTCLLKLSYVNNVTVIFGIAMERLLFRYQGKTTFCSTKKNL